MPKIRLFVGAGTATETYLRTLEVDGWNTLVVGDRGLWGHLPGNRHMGQPAHLLQLPGQAVPPFRTPSGITDDGLADFMSVHAYQTGLQQINQPSPERLNLPTCKVTSISRAGARLKVHVRGRTGQADLLVDQVVMANGIGPQKTPEQAGIVVTGTADSTLGFKQIEEGTDYLTHPDRVGRQVVVFGGGPTGAWVAGEVADRTPVWCWAARIGGEGFSRSKLPGDRNAMILAMVERQFRVNIVSARYIRVGELSYPMAGDPRPATPKVELTLSRGPDTPNFKLYVDQLIYCIGGDPAAEGSIASLLDPDLCADLEPVRDRNRMVSADGNGVLAWRNRPGDVLIIGAATYNFSIEGLKPKQGAPMAFLPRNAQVPDGIALTVAVLETINQTMPVTRRPQPGLPRFDWTINFNTANRTQIAVFLADQSELDAFMINLTVALIIYFRSAEPQTFGITNEQMAYIARIVRESVEAVRVANNPGFEDLRRVVEGPDSPFDVDNVLDNFVAAMTRDRWIDIWATGGLRPAARR